MSGVGVEVLSGSSVRVSWNYTNFQAITDFLVYYRDIEDGRTQEESEMSVVTGPGASSVDVDGLVSGSTYEFQVVTRMAVNGEEITSDRSDAITYYLPYVSTVLETTSKCLFGINCLLFYYILFAISHYV